MIYHVYMAIDGELYPILIYMYVYIYSYIPIGGAMVLISVAKCRCVPSQALRRCTFGSPMMILGHAMAMMG